MLDTVKNFFSKNARSIKKIFRKVSKPAMVLAYLYAFLIILLIVTMYIMCITAWIYGKEVYSWLLQLLEKCVSMPFVAAMVFLGSCFFDSDSDGTPDAFDKYNDKATNQFQNMQYRNQYQSQQSLIRRDDVNG